MREATKIYLVANSHIDPVWLWDKYEGIDEVIGTFRSACDRLDEYPRLKFSASSACFYKWVEQYAPDVFARIAALVAAGRWEIVGGWWVETDCNLPLTESFRKNAEISRNYLRSRFGVATPVAFSPDSFGHAATLPALLAEAGFKYYVFCRPDMKEKSDLPGNLFYWQRGGSKVLCYRLPHHYTQGVDFSRDRVARELGAEEFSRRGLGCYFFGLGDHGGGPAKAEIDTLQALMTERPGLNLAFATCLEFFQAAERLAEIPVYSGDLQHHAVGCYSVNRELKHAIRSGERALIHADRVLSVLKHADPAVTEPLWERTIFNQFHDIMPGSCSRLAAGQAQAEMGGVRTACDEITYAALQRNAAALPVRCPQGEYRIFNSLPFPVTGPFEVESFMYYRPGAPFKDGTGTEIPVQEIAPSCSSRRWIFIDTIPAGSTQSYYFDTTAGPSPVQDTGYFLASGDRVGNGTFEMSSPGLIVAPAGAGAFFKEAVSLGIIRDDSDTWSHFRTGYGQPACWFREESSAVKEGRVVSYLVSHQRGGNSTAELRFAVYRDLPYVDVDIIVKWAEPCSVLKLCLRPASPFDTLLVQGPGGAIEKRTEGAEEPLHGWLLAGDLGIVQDGAFAFDRCGDTVRITLVRSNLYGHDHTIKLDPHGIHEHTDLGEHRFKFRLVKRAGLTAAELDRLSAALVEPFRLVRCTSSPRTEIIHH